MEKTYNLEQIRYLLAEAFDDHGIKLLCFDCFHPFYEEINWEMEKSSKIISLVDYCKRYGHIDYLLSIIEERNHYQFNRYKNKLFFEDYSYTNSTTIQIKVNGNFPDIMNREHLVIIKTKIFEALFEIQKLSSKDKKLNLRKIEIAQTQEYSTEDDNGSN